MERLKDVVSFNSELFFLILLPPIIFESGYNMNKRVFFAHFGSIAAYAIAGTLISTTVVGVGLWAVSVSGILRYQLTLVECLVRAPYPLLSLSHTSRGDTDMVAACGVC